MRTYIKPAALAASLVLSASGAAADAIKPETMARNCFTCHGTGGHPVNGLAPLAGIDAKAIETSMIDFRNDRRQATIMNRIARGLSEAEIAALAQYLSTLK
ncbi:MAG: c-type cytochrome [Alphaproteobacteria bacterium]|nr:c-type cytochrome [Alphaproteobacteria bacterium]